MEELQNFNIFSEAKNDPIFLQKLDLDGFIEFLKDYNENIIFHNIKIIEQLIDSQFFFSINTKNDSFNELEKKLTLFNSIVLIIESKLYESTLKPKQKEKAKGKLKDLNTKINIYKIFYEQRTSRNLTTNIAHISDFNTKKGLVFLGNNKDNDIFYLKECFKNIKKYQFNKKILVIILINIIIFIILFLLYLETKSYSNLNFGHFLIVFLSIIIFYIISNSKALKYEKFKEILVNTYRFSSISQWLFYINENTNSDLNKIGEQRKLVQYYDEHLEKEQNRQVKYGYAKKLFVLLVIESILLFIAFGYLINKLTINELNQISNLIKWVFGLTLGQIVGMVLIIVKYLFKDNGKISNLNTEQ